MLLLFTKQVGSSTSTKKAVVYDTQILYTKYTITLCTQALI